jgi:hypothetical protein
MTRRWLGLLLLTVLAVGCSDESKSGNADSVSGPGVDIHCAGQLRRGQLLPGQGGGVGSTNVHTACAPTTP